MKMGKETNRRYEQKITSREFVSTSRYCHRPQQSITHCASLQVRFQQELNDKQFWKQVKENTPQLKSLHSICLVSINTHTHSHTPLFQTKEVVFECLCCLWFCCNGIELVPKRQKSQTHPHPCSTLCLGHSSALA